MIRIGRGRVAKCTDALPEAMYHGRFDDDYDILDMQERGVGRTEAYDV